MDLVDMPEPAMNLAQVAMEVRADHQREPVVISYEMALKGLKAAVEVKGSDYRYQPYASTRSNQGSCRYFDQQQQPSCIVGHVLDSLGVAPFDFDHRLNAVGVAMLEGSIIQYDQDDREKTGSLLYHAQQYQDSGRPWGHAVDKAVALDD